jgi:SAM-dependent methyltransferase
MNQSLPTRARLDPPALRCPACWHALGQTLECGGCGAKYPTVRGVPVLVDERESAFSVADVSRGAAVSHRSRMIRRVVPSISSNLDTEEVYADLKARLLRRPAARVLCIGSGDGGKGFEELCDPAISIVFTDVAVNPLIDYAVDAHRLPFDDASFDAVVAQAVLEHVADPVLCVAEIHRVLRSDGLIFAETPFMQQVHLGRYDFTRFTHLGHRRLFRMFTEVRSGQVSSTGSALAWSLTYFLASLGSSRRQRQVLYSIGRCSFFWLRYLDRWTSQNPGSWDAAGSFYFLGTRAAEPVRDREIVAGYRGAQG